jgi:psp operon transcriptional activator
MERTASLVGQSTAFLDAVEHASRVAQVDRPVLVIGERGTGKELVAERLHRLSNRWGGPLVTMNCAALPETLVDAELFGHEAGAFTGATRARAGRFEEADGGTLFLDEIGTLSPAAQERLLRVIEYGELTRIGSNRVVTVDVRVVGATNADLPAEAARNRFRADLLDRLSFEVITLPPLRARADDVPVLAEHFARRMIAELGWERFPGFSRTAMQKLTAHDWPGNVRELKNVVERSLYRWGDQSRAIDMVVLDPFESPWRPQSVHAPAPMHPPTPADVPTVPRPGAATAERTGQGADTSPPTLTAVTDLRAAVVAFERKILQATLERCRYNQRATAAALSLTYDQLRHCLRRHELL